MNPFIPAWLDDLAVKPTTFRVLCHLWRRAGRDGICYPAAASIAKSCKINRDTVWAVLTELEGLGLLKREKAFRNSNRYLLYAPDRVGGNEGPTQSELAERKGLQLAESDGLQLAETEGCQLAERKGHKGSPMKVPQLRVSNEGGANPPPADGSFPWRSIDDLAPELRAVLDDTFPDGCQLREVFEQVRGRELKFKGRQANLGDWTAVLRESIGAIAEKMDRAPKLGAAWAHDGSRRKPSPQVQRWHEAERGLAERREPLVQHLGAGEGPTGWQSFVARELAGSPFAPGGDRYSDSWEHLPQHARDSIEKQMKEFENVPFDVGTPSA